MTGYPIFLDRVSKEYILRRHGKEFPSDRREEKLSAVKNISLKIEKGRCLGIIGPNGSGKSTLLKLIAGLIEPTSGNIIVNGKILAMLDLGMGFQDDLTGKENIYLYGFLLGMNKRELKDKYRKIVEFSDLERFIDIKLKEYSSGMKLRLAFATAMIAEPELILIDEVLSVGDDEFQRKSYNRVKMMKDAGKTLVIVSHDLSNIRELCDEAIFLLGGEIKARGTPQAVIYSYLSASKRIEKERVRNSLSAYSKMLAEIEQKSFPAGLPEKKKSPLSGLISKITGKQAMDYSLERKKIIAEMRDLAQEWIRINENEIMNLESDASSGCLESERNRKILAELDKFWHTLKLYLKVENTLTYKELSFLKEALDIEVSLLQKGKRRENCLIRKIDIMQLLMANSDKIGKKALCEQLKAFCMSFEPEKTAPATLRHALKAYHDSAVYVIQKDELEYNLSMIKRSYLLYLNEEIEAARQQEDLDKGEALKSISRERRAYLEIWKESLATPLADSLINEEKQEKEKKAILKSVRFADSRNIEKEVFFTGESMKIQIDYYADSKIENPVFGVGIYKDDGTHITGPNTKFHRIEIPYIEGGGSISYIIEEVPFLDGRYYVSVTIHPYDSFTPYDHHEKKYSFEVKSSELKEFGIIHIKSRWEIENE